MCRLTAYLGAPLPVARLVFGGKHCLYRQSWAPRELLSGSVNADGWGTAWWREGRALRLARTEPVWRDPTLEPVLESVEATCAVAALRNTTPGLPSELAAVPPLVHGRWAFVLNGFVPSFRTGHMRALRERLPDDLYAELKGASDTETLFYLGVAALRDGASPAEALEDLVTTVLDRVARGPETAECHLTMLLADGEVVAACRASNVEETNTLYLAEGGPLAPAGVLLASETLDDDATWRRVPPQSVVTVGPDGPRVRPLATI